MSSLKGDPRTAAAAASRGRLAPRSKVHDDLLLNTLEPSERVERFITDHSWAGPFHLAVTTERLLVISAGPRPTVTAVPRPLRLRSGPSGGPNRVFYVAGPAGDIKITTMKPDDVQALLNAATISPPTPRPTRAHTDTAPRTSSRPTPTSAPPPRTSPSPPAPTPAAPRPPLSGTHTWRSSRPLFTPQDAEAVAVEHMVYLGFADAMATPAGSDGGLDAVSRQAAAQVKFYETTPIGRPAIQQLVGAAIRHEFRLFYASSGYTPAARGYADDHGVYLFTLGRDATVVPENGAARALWSTASERLTDPDYARRLQRERRAEEDLEVYCQAVADRASALLQELRRLTRHRNNRTRKKAGKALTELGKVLGTLTAALEGNRPLAERRHRAKKADRQIKSIARDFGIKFHR